MSRFFSLLCTLLSAFALSAQQSDAPASSSTQAIYNAQAQSAQKKFDYIAQNGARRHPDPAPTVIKEGELNAWLLSGKAKLPQGVKKLQVSGDPGIIHATATVDFDEITASKRSSNPLLGLFTGTHVVQATAHAAGVGGQGQVHIDSVALDGVTVPRMALEFFADKYIKPKYPNLGIDSRFALPDRIDTATVGTHQLTITQK